MGYIQLAIIYVLELLIEFSFANRVFQRKFKTGMVLTISFCLYLILYVVYYAYLNSVINFILSAIIYYLMLLICYEGKQFTKILCSIVLSLLMTVSENCTIFLFLGSMNIEQLMNNNQTQLFVFALCSKILYFIFTMIFVLVINRNDRYSSKKYLPLFIIPATTVALEILFYKITAAYEISKGYINAIVVISVLFSILSLIVFLYYQQLEEKDREIKELEKEQQFVELNNSYMQVLEHQNNEMRMMFHDTKNHYNAIANMDSTEEIHSYVDALFDDIQKYQIIKLTDNKMLDLLLSKYKAVCGSKNISFNIEVKTANLDYIDDSDLSILVCNLLDNAVESAEQSAEKSIIFSLRRVNTFDVLNVINSCDTEPVIKGKIIKTSKEDKSSHGYGIKIISKYAKKNNAEYEWHYDNEAKKFNSTLIFKR